MRNVDFVIRMLLCWFALQGYVSGLPAVSNINSMTVSRMEMADLETSATGYSYHQQHGAPASYVHYNNQGSGHYYNAPKPVHYVASSHVNEPVLTPLAYGAPKTVLQIEPVSVQYNKPVPENYQVGLPAGYVVPLLPPIKEPLAPYYNVPIRVVEQVPEKVEIADDDEDDDDDDDDHYDHDDEDDDDDDNDDDDDDDDDEHDFGPKHRGVHIPITPLGNGFVKSNHQQGQGAAHNAGEYSAHGEKGDKAYKKHHGFDKGEKGEHDSENHKGHYSQDTGNEKSHSDTAGHYDKHDEVSKGEKGASYGVDASHKKGHKTTGFHNVYHKDEYKKDTDFYDDAHKGGHFEKHGKSGTHHASAEGRLKKGGHHDSGYTENEAGKDGEFDKGHDFKEAKGHKGAEGQETYHENYSDYAEKDAASEDKAHGYSKGHHHPSKYST